MLKHPRTSRTAITGFEVIMAVMVIIAAINYIRFTIPSYGHRKHTIIAVLFIVAAIMFLYYAVRSYCRYLGLFEGATAFRIRQQLVTQLKDAEFYTPSMLPDCVVLPKIVIDLSVDEMTGTIMIENILRYHKRLDDDFSMAFANYIVDAYYVSDDGNWFIYEIMRADYDYKLRFKSFNDFMWQLSCMPSYTLFIDRNLKLPLQMTMIVGQQGSGKSYATYNIVLQLLLMNARMYFADPKAAGLKTLGDAIDSNNTAVSFEDICALLRKFNSVLQERNNLVREKLGSQLEGDFRSLGWEPHVLIFEEYSAFQAVLQTRDKKIRDEINGIIEQIVFMGRQCGCLIIIIGQQISAQTLPTKVRDQLSAKFLLARGLETETAICAFGQTDAADLPKRNAVAGEAFYKVSGLNAKPKRCEFPELSFDILKAVDDCR